MDATTAAGKMLTEPDKFFKYYPVQMAGGAGPWINNSANLKIFRLAKKNAGTLGTAHGQQSKEGHYGASRPGFLHTKDISSFKMDQSVQAGCSGALNTHGVPMVNYNSNIYGAQNLGGNITNMPHFTCGGGANYMTTGLLTGCCFAWLQQGADLWCIHVQPKDNITGVQLHNAINTNGRFNGAATSPLSTFGHNDYIGSYAVVIGVKSAGVWKLYAQTSSDQFRTITRAKRLHPGAVTIL